MSLSANSTPSTNQKASTPLPSAVIPATAVMALNWRVMTSRSSRTQPTGISAAVGTPAVRRGRGQRVQDKDGHDGAHQNIQRELDRAGHRAANHRARTPGRALAQSGEADAYPGRHRRRRPGRADAGPPAARQGIESVVLESRAASTSSSGCAPACSSRARSTCWCATGVGERLQREGLVHHGIELRFEGRRHRIPLSELTGGRSDHRLRPAGSGQGPDRGAPGGRRADPVRGRGAWRIEDLDSRCAAGALSTARRATSSWQCDIVAGCDGFWGVCRAGDSRRAC